MERWHVHGQPPRASRRHAPDREAWAPQWEWERRPPVRIAGDDPPSDGSSFEGVEAEVTPLRWEDGELLVLDQRRLPAEEDWVRCRTAGQVADCIRSMAVRGAPAIGLAAAYGIALAARGGEDIASAADRLRDTRPT